MHVHFQSITKTVVIYLMVLIILHFMGKREIGKLSPFDFVVAIIIAELAAIPMEDPKTPLSHGMVPIVTLGVLEVGLSLMALKSMTIRNLVYGRPQIVIARGEILMDEMRKARYNLTDLLSQLREQGYADIEDVEFGILENSGKLSVLPKPCKRPITPEDLNLETRYEGLPVPVIMDGQIIQEGLRVVGISENQLKSRLNAEGYASYKKVLFATIDPHGYLFVNMKNHGKSEGTGYLG